MVYEAIASSGSQTLISAYIITAFLSGLGYLFLSQKWSDVPRKFSLIHFFIVTWSGIMYLNFLNETPISKFGWYADWMLSTPLILLALSLTAMYERETDWGLIGALTGLQFMLVVTGIISQETGATYAYWIGNMLLLGVIYIIWKPLKQIAEETSDAIGRNYKILAGYITILFLMYPTVWYLGLPGPLNILNAYETSAAFVILPFFCKQIYGFLDLYLIQKTEKEN